MLKLPQNFHPPKHGSTGIKLTATIQTHYKVVDIETLLKNGVRLLHIQLAFNTKEEIERNLLNIETAIGNFEYASKRYHLPISRIFEIRGRTVRVGQMRNDQAVWLRPKQKITLTTNRQYELCGLPEVVFVSNFAHYIPRLKIGDFIFINGQSIQLFVIKIICGQVTCCVLKKGKLASYAEVILPVFLPETAKLLDTELEDIEFTMENGADFILVPQVACADYYNGLMAASKGCLRIICCLDAFLVKDEDMLENIVKKFDGIWLEQLRAKTNRGYVQKVLNLARKFEKFAMVKWTNNTKEMSEFFNESNSIDSVIFYRKDQMVQVLHCLRNIKPKIRRDSSLKAYRTRDIFLNCVIRAANAAKAKVIICLSASGKTATKLANLRPHPLILALVNCDHDTLRLNAWKNVHSLVLPTLYSDPCLDWKDFVMKQMRYSLKYGKDMKWIRKGDAVVFCFESCLGLKRPDSICTACVGTDQICLK